MLCDERSQLQTTLQLLGAVKEVVFLTPFPVNVSAAGNCLELVDEDRDGVIEGVSAFDLSTEVGIAACAWFVFVCCDSVDPRQPAQISTRLTIATASTMERPNQTKRVMRNFAILLSCCLG